MPCGKFVLNDRYLLKVPDGDQSEELFVLCPVDMENVHNANKGN